jgi:hypothetical protein
LQNSFHFIDFINHFIVSFFIFFCHNFIYNIENNFNGSIISLLFEFCAFAIIIEIVWSICSNTLFIINDKLVNSPTIMDLHLILSVLLS